MSTFDELARRATQACLATATCLLAGTVLAQVPPTLTLGDASILEGNSGSVVLRFPISFYGAQPNEVRGRVTAEPLSGSGFNAAIGGVACGTSGVDFEQFANVSFTIPPNTVNGSLNIGVRICPDTVNEPNEHIHVFFSDVVGAQCNETSCNAIGTILNDDPPELRINNIAISEPSSGTSTALFTVYLSNPSPQPSSVGYRTRDGGATAGSDYLAKSGTLNIPAQAGFAQFGITIRADGLRENDESFYVDLVSPTANATIADATGRAIIRNTAPATGGFQLSPDDAVVPVGEPVIYSVDWTVPAGRVWRNLESIDFRIRGGKTALWVRWDEASNMLSLCRKGGKHDEDEGDDGIVDDAGRGPGAHAVCTPGGLPGSAGVLETKYARLHLAESDVVGSGPKGQVVTLELALSFLEKAGGHEYHVDLAATDDFGNEDPFFRASALRVEKPGRH